MQGKASLKLICEKILKTYIQGVVTVKNLDDGEELMLTDEAFQILGFNGEQIDGIYKIAAAIMHHMNMNFRQGFNFC